jgi:hypothetical protein
MDQEKKVKELQDKIYDLSADLNSSLHQLRILQAELDALRLSPGNTMNEKPVDLKNKHVAIPGPSSFSGSPGIEISLV